MGFIASNLFVRLLALARLSLSSPVADGSLNDHDATLAQVSLSTLNFGSDKQFENHWNAPGFDLDLDALCLIRFSLDKDEEPVWMTEREKLCVKKAGISYIDVNKHPTFGLNNSVFQIQQYVSYPTPNSTFVPKSFSLLSSDKQKSNLEMFTSFYTRYYNSNTGHASSCWLFNRALNYTNTYASLALRAAVNIEVVLVEHKFKQESMIICLTPCTPAVASTSEAITIIGAHCNSINGENPLFRSPGADDDRSGTITVLEAMRGILASGYIPTSPLDFHFYAGEEGGLLGSLNIANAYTKANKTVRGMMEFNMTVSAL